MSNNERIVWGIEYSIKIDKKRRKNWAGPVGIYVFGVSSDEMKSIWSDRLTDRPFFFRTRKQAITEARKLTDKEVRTRVKKYILSWKES